MASVDGVVFLPHRTFYLGSNVCLDVRWDRPRRGSGHTRACLWASLDAWRGRRRVDAAPGGVLAEWSGRGGNATLKRCCHRGRVLVHERRRRGCPGRAGRGAGQGCVVQRRLCPARTRGLEPARPSGTGQEEQPSVALARSGLALPRTHAWSLLACLGVSNGGRLLALVAIPFPPPKPVVWSRRHW